MTMSFNKFASVVVLTIMPTLSFAQTSTSTSTSTGIGQSQSSITQNSTGVQHAPVIGGAQTNSTAECVKGYGGSLSSLFSGLPLGFGAAVPITDKDCVTRLEAKLIVDIFNIPAGKQRNAAIYHFCKNDKSMRETLVAIGLCTVSTAQKK